MTFVSRHPCTWYLCRGQGQKTDNHQVTEELNRIKGYMGKLKEANGSAHKEQQRLKLNKDAVRDWLSCVSIVHVYFDLVALCCSGLLRDWV
jgi:hypothetical protein